MPFPTTSLLDAFTGAGPTAPPSANWTKPLDIANNLRLTNNQVDSNNVNGSGLNYWNPATFGPDVENYITVATLYTTAAFVIRLHSRMQQEQVSASSRDGYHFEWAFQTGVGDDTYKLFRLDNIVSTQLGSTTTGPDLAAGDKLGFEIIGSTLTGYRFNGSSWSSLVTATDSTYTTAGHIGVQLRDQVVKIDDFSGGTVVPAAAAPRVVVSREAVNRASRW